MYFNYVLYNFNQKIDIWMVQGMNITIKQMRRTVSLLASLTVSSSLRNSFIFKCNVARMGRSGFLSTNTHATRFDSEVVGDLISNFGNIGAFAEVQHIFDQDDVRLFGGLCGDNNPLHVDPEYAANTIFGGTIVHGIFVSSLFSTLFGRTIAGSIYVSQDLKFKRPVHVGKSVTARIEIIEVQEKSKGLLITCSTKCKLDEDKGKVAVDGTAKVLVPKVIVDNLMRLRDT